MTEPWVATSPMCGRLVVVAGDGEAAGTRAAALRALPGWTGAPATRIGATAGGWLAGYDLGGGSSGLAALVPPPTFLGALRELTDAPYLALARMHGARGVVDVVDDAGLVAVRRLYPDALVVSPDGPDPVLPELPPLPDSDPAGSGFDGAGLIVLVGSGRSGTTWLHRLLTAHPDVTGTADGETWLFHGAARFRREHDRAPDGLAGWIAGDALDAAIRRCCDRLLEAGRDRLDPRAGHFVEKTPAHVWDLPLIARLYPEAAFVHLIRDGRDVALSLYRLEGAYDDLAAAGAAWVRAVSAVRAAAPSLPRYVEVRYEDLLADPVGVSGSALERIGVPADDAFAALAAARVAERVSPLPSRGPIGTEKWRGLDDESIRAMDLVAGGLLRELGYA